MTTTATPKKPSNYGWAVLGLLAVATALSLGLALLREPDDVPA